MTDFFPEQPYNALPLLPPPVFGRSGFVRDSRVVPQSVYHSTQATVLSVFGSDRQTAANYLNSDLAPVKKHQ